MHYLQNKIYYLINVYLRGTEQKPPNISVVVSSVLTARLKVNQSFSLCDFTQELG